MGFIILSVISGFIILLSRKLGVSTVSLRALLDQRTDTISKLGCNFYCLFRFFLIVGKFFKSNTEIFIPCISTWGERYYHRRFVHFYNFFNRFIVTTISVCGFCVFWKCCYQFFTCSFSPEYVLIFSGSRFKNIVPPEPRSGPSQVIFKTGYPGFNCLYWRGIVFRNREIYFFGSMTEEYGINSVFHWKLK